MSQDERERVADRLADEYTTMLDFVRTATALLATLPILYGVATWIFGDALWSGSAVYRAALEVPWAPESWGTVFVALGVVLVIAAIRQRHRATVVAATLTAFVLGMFMVSFAASAVIHSNLSGIPPAFVYGVLSLVFLARARLAYRAYRREQAA